MHRRHINEITEYLNMKGWNLYAVITDNTKEDTPEWERHTLISTQTAHYNTTIFQTFALKTLWKTTDKSLALPEAYGPKDSTAMLFAHPSIQCTCIMMNSYALAAWWTVVFTWLPASFLSRDCIPYPKSQGKATLFLCQSFSLSPAINTEFKAVRMLSKPQEAVARTTYRHRTTQVWQTQQTRCGTTPTIPNPDIHCLYNLWEAQLLTKDFAFAIRDVALGALPTQPLRDIKTEWDLYKTLSPCPVGAQRRGASISCPTCRTQAGCLGTSRCAAQGAARGA